MARAAGCERRRYLAFRAWWLWDVEWREWPCGHTVIEQAPQGAGRCASRLAAGLRRRDGWRVLACEVCDVVLDADTA